MTKMDISDDSKAYITDTKLLEARNNIIQSTREYMQFEHSDMTVLCTSGYQGI